MMIAIRELVMLVVEDNPADVIFLQEAIEATGTPAQMEVVSNGLEAMQYLRREEQYTGAPRPDVLVLDLNLPIKHGREVLKEMASDAALRTIPVVILTTSSSETSVCDSYPPGRCLYFTKTEDFKKLQEIVEQITDHANRTALDDQP